MAEIVIVDYGSSNLHSVARALEFVAASSHRIRVSAQAATIAAADRVVFPGQGAIGDCMQRVTALGLAEVLRECVRTRPFLGICLGLQSLLSHSDEDGGTACLDIIPGKVVRFAHGARDPRDGSACKIPHMGWNEVTWTREHALTRGIESGARFYFVHSYYVEPATPDVVAGRTLYIDSFVSAVAFGNAFATQFHPEKSQQAGLQLLRNFVGWDGGA